jgi:hypothetical protein
MANDSASRPAQAAMSRTYREQERWHRSCRRAIVRCPEERDAATRHDAAHLEGRELDGGNRVDEQSLVGHCDEVLAILKAWRQMVPEEPRRGSHDPVCHGRRAGED